MHLAKWTAILAMQSYAENVNEAEVAAFKPSRYLCELHSLLVRPAPGFNFIILLVRIQVREVEVVVVKRVATAD